MNLAEQININTEHEELARKIYEGEIEFGDVVNAIMRGEIEVHGVDLRDCISEALGDDDVAYHARGVVISELHSAATVDFNRALNRQVEIEIKNALTNIVREHCHGWGRD